MRKTIPTACAVLLVVAACAQDLPAPPAAPCVVLDQENWHRGPISETNAIATTEDEWRPWLVAYDKALRGAFTACVAETGAWRVEQRPEGWTVLTGADSAQHVLGVFAKEDVARAFSAATGAVLRRAPRSRG
jgi:hypothetical protein